MPRPRILFAFSITALIALAWAAYRPALETFFLNEDFIWLYRCRLNEQQSLSDLLTRDVMLGSYSWRPLVQAWFGLNFAWLGWNAFGYHLQAWALHVATALFLYLLAVTWRGHRFALLCATLFAVHPAHVESIAWTSAIGGPLSSLPMVAALYVWQQQCRASSGTTLLASGVATLLFLAALAAQENALVFLVWLPLFSTQFGDARHIKTRTVILWFLLLLTAVIFGLVRSWESPAAWSPPAAALPFGSRAAWYHSLMHVAQNLARAFDRLVPIPGMGVPFHLVAAGVAGWRAIRGDWLPAVASVCFLAALLPYTTLFFGVAPRYLHLPLVAWAIGIASLLWPVAQPAHPIRPAFVACLLVAWFAVLLPRIHDESERFARRSAATLSLLGAIRRALPAAPSGAELAFAGLGEWRLQHDAFVFGLEEAVRLVYQDSTLRVRFVPLGASVPGAMLLIWDGEHFRVGS